MHTYLVGFGGGVNERSHVKALVTHPLRTTCASSLPLREMSGNIGTCVREGTCEGWVAMTKRGFPSSYLWGPRRSGNRDPAFGCHPRRPGNCLGSLRNCRRSAQPLHSSGEDRMSQAHRNSRVLRILGFSLNQWKEPRPGHSMGMWKVSAGARNASFLVPG